MSNTNDPDRELIARISQTLALLSQRQQLMDEWERQAAARETTQPTRPSITPRRRRAIALSIAAGLAICITAAYSSRHAHKQQTAAINETSEQTAPFRSAATTNDIAQLIAQENYTAALAAVDSQEKELQQEQQTIHTAANATLSEEEEYATLLRQEQIYQLQWLRIEALIGLNRTDEAHTLLSTFANNEGEHQQQAKQLLRSLGN